MMRVVGEAEYFTAAELPEERVTVDQEPSATRFKTVSLDELRGLNLPVRDMVLAPILPAKGSGMVFAQRGIGKTHVGLNVAYAVASGGAFLKWTAPQPRRVLYCDGEMPARALQDRMNTLVLSSDNALPAPDFLRFLAMDMQDLGTGLNLAKAEDQKAVEAELKGAELVIFDNLSTLVSGGRENDAESWDAMQGWLLRLRRRGVTVLLIHHAGRGENARGTSKREDVLDTVVHLKRPENYQPSEGARFEVHLTKARGVFGEEATPFEAKLEEFNGRSTWTMKAVADAETEQITDMSQARMSVRDIATELGISKSKVARVQGKLREEGKI